MQFATLDFLSVFLSNAIGQKKFWNQFVSPNNYSLNFERTQIKVYTQEIKNIKSLITLEFCQFT